LTEPAKGPEIATRVGRLLVAKGWTLSTAESCTGGLIGHYITNVSGSSDFYLGGIVAYANRVKQTILGVSEELLRTCGAVSPEVALAMAEGVRRELGTHIGLSVTGIAGPTGGSADKPVGTVFIGLAGPLGAKVRHYCWSEDRVGNKRLSAEAALALLEEYLLGAVQSQGLGEATR